MPELTARTSTPSPASTTRQPAANTALWVGIDLGTQSVKVSIVDDRGVVAASTALPLVSRRQGVRHEQDPEHWIMQAAAALAAALATLPPAAVARISGVSICATSGTVTTVDAGGRPCSPGIMYDDARAGDLGAEANDADPVRWARLGYRIQPTWALPKIVWLGRSGALTEGRFVAHQADVVAAAMVGTRVATDWSHALKSGYDMLALEWPVNALKTLDINPAQVPSVVAPGTELGRSRTAWAESTGLPAGTPVFAGMTDGCAAQLGAATLGLGDWHSVIGTTLVLKGVTDRIIIDDAGAVYSHRAPHDGLWFPGGASSVGAGAITSALPSIDLAGSSDRLSGLGDRLGSIPISYPLAGTGERFPLIRPDACGFVSVDGVDHSLAEAAVLLEPDLLLASIMLGIACVERLSFDTLARAGAAVDGRLSSSGGGTHNEWWTQLRADLLGRTITIPRSSEGSIGMAILAAWAGTAGSALPETASRMSSVGRIVEPRTAYAAVWNDRYEAFVAELGAKDWILA
ncbi:FGGY-family carbohydrate kinase [Cryobacterium serini]|uniref:Carbohydrate kinase n=1 Tax=Cryobacterium serini TaxID=1259201 RepID=A0A4R9BLG5_9MICO|nr:FGGY-family carbohydrate kinase [Cryobacterium serini]TFD86613.1 carbohydrate kinase [Cryobacterium serini]